MTFIGRSLRGVGPELGPLLDELLWHLVRGRWRKAAQLHSRELTLPLNGGTFRGSPGRSGYPL